MMHWVAVAVAAAALGATNDTGLADATELVRQLRTNYAGYAYRASLAGDRLRESEADLLARAGDLDDAALDAAIRAHLSLFEDGHLRLASEHSRHVWPDLGFTRIYFERTPSWRALGDDASVLVIPSFDDGWLDPIRELVAAHAPELSSRETLIIDVRGNGGGSDICYAALLPWVLDGPVEEVGSRLLATPENASYWEEASEYLEGEGQGEIAAYLRERVAAMRAFGAGLMPGGATDVFTPEVVHARPLRVGIIVDPGCASTTEQFLLAARQSGRVTLFGDRTMGALDYANLREVVLPSVARTVHFGMSISGRLPDAPVDGVGIPVDVAMDRSVLYDEAGAIEWVRAWLAGAE